MKLKPWLVTLALIGIIFCVMFFASRRPQSVLFAGHTLRLPWPWRVSRTGTTGGTLSIRRDDYRNTGSVDLLDERKSPLDAAHFVERWKSVAGTQHFHPESLEEYHDPAVDTAGMRCVRIRWKDDALPLEINCVTGDGSWKIVLLGKDRDVQGLDLLARQVQAFEHGS